MGLAAGVLQGSGAHASDAPVTQEALRGALEYRLVGPYRGGRVTAVTGVPSAPLTFYMGSTGGGVWKTVDGGKSWVNVSDPPSGDEAPATGAGDRFGSASVGAIAVAPSDPNVVYVGMGSVDIRGNTSAGDGVYRSDDAGETWRHVGLPEAGQIGRVRVHPEDPDLVYVAALGHAFGPNPERGVYRSTDGGQSWEKVLPGGETVGAVDLVMDPTNPRILYASTWRAERKPWTMISGGAGSGLWKSADGGDSWVELTEGLPEPPRGKIGIAVSPARPERVWALVEHETDWGLYRSDDAGAHFERVSDDRNLIQRAWYYTHVYADPKDPQTVWVTNVQLWRSDDGGRTFENVPVPHADNHDLWIHPNEPRIMINGNDGGANVSYDGGESWSTQANQPTAEMYRVTVDGGFPYRIYGAQQDNSTVSIPVRPRDGSVDRDDWWSVGGCESGHIAVDPRDRDIVYAGCYGGTITRYDHERRQADQIMAYPELALGQPARELEYRFQWNAPIRLSPHDPDVVYHCSQYVHRSPDQGETWEVISPDLTRDDESKQGYAGEPITRDNTGVEVYGTIFSFEESPHEPGLLWAGTDDGLVHLSRDGGASWREITPEAMPEWGTVNTIELSPHDPGKAYIAVHRYRMDDFRPYVFRTDDHGQSWEMISPEGAGIPFDHFVRVVREDPVREGLLYAGSEFGMYLSFDDGASWQPLQLNLPVTPITDLAVRHGDLVVATQGRSFWVLEDLSPLRQLNERTADADLHLFEPRPAVLFGPYGADITYAIGRELDPDGDGTPQELSLEILDAEGEVLRSLSSQQEEYRAPNPSSALRPVPEAPRTVPAQQGMNRWSWDLRVEDPKLVGGEAMWGTARGPRVPPGSYTVRVSLGDATREASLEVAPDPTAEVSTDALEARYELARKVSASLEATHDLLRELGSLRDQLDVWEARLEQSETAGRAEPLLKRARESIAELEGRLTQPKASGLQDILNYPPQLDAQWLFLQRTVEGKQGAPSAGARQRFEDLTDKLEQARSSLEAIHAEQIAALNDLVRELALPPVR
jgi:photosystem II stability/assembly factor-like uncharacterized protein